MKKLFNSSIWRFLLVGIGNTLLSMILMFLLESLGYWPSTAIAYIAGGILSFFLNRSFTFQCNAPFWPSAGKFALTVAICYILAYSLAQPLVSQLLSDTPISLLWQERLTKLCGMGLYTCINYLGQRFFAFRTNNHA